MNKTRPIPSLAIDLVHLVGRPYENTAHSRLTPTSVIYQNVEHERRHFAKSVIVCLLTPCMW